VSDKAAKAAIYLDSSMIIALVAEDDPHHRAAVRLVRPAQRTTVTSSVTEVEVGRSLMRRAAPRSVQQAARELLVRCEVVELTAEIRSEAVKVRPSSVRSLDAIHVASALAGGITEFASFDLRQRVAAEEMGLKLLA